MTPQRLAGHGPGDERKPQVDLRGEFTHRLLSRGNDLSLHLAAHRLLYPRVDDARAAGRRAASDQLPQRSTPPQVEIASDGVTSFFITFFTL